MQGAYRSSTWLRFNKLRRKKRVQTGMTFALVFLGPLLAVATFLALGFLNQSANSPFLRVILLADFVYVLVVAALVMARVVRMISDRRSQSAGSRLHLRLTMVFAVVALIPTVLVAVFAVLTLNVGLRAGFPSGSAMWSDHRFRPRRPMRKNTVARCRPMPILLPPI